MSIQQPDLTVPSESTTEYRFGDVHNTEMVRKEIKIISFCGDFSKG